MITGVTLNPCIDKTINVPSFVYGGTNRIESERLDVGGKGFNVARATSRLGEKAGATGLLFSENGAYAQKELEDEGIEVDCVWLDGRIRTNTKLFDMERRIVTELNERGGMVSPQALDEVADKVVAWARKSEYMAFSGSLPPGCPDDFYRRLIQLAKPYCRPVLDAEGKKLLEGIQAKPYLIKPNRFEIEMLVGRTLRSLSEIKEAACDIVGQGVAIVAVSLGAEGALITDGKTSCYAPRVDVIVRGTVAAGDSMVAGLCVGLRRELPLADAFRLGVASATACVTHEGTGLPGQSFIDEIYEKVRVESI